MPSVPCGDVPGLKRRPREPDGFAPGGSDRSGGEGICLGAATRGPDTDLPLEAEPAPLGSARLQKCQILECTASFPRIRANHPRTGSNDKGRGTLLGPNSNENLMSNLSIGLESQ